MSVDTSWYEELTAQAEQAFVEGRLERSCSLLEKAESLAHAKGDSERADEAFCRRLALLLELDELDEGGDDLARLKKILLRSGKLKTRWMAAYYSAVAYDLMGERKKAFSYAARSVSLADELGDALSVAGSSNLLGTLALMTSDLEQAQEAYQTALDIYAATGGMQEIMESQVEDNLGYVMICSGRLGEGIAHCEQARRTIERIGANHFLHQTLQDLCYGYLLADRLDEAQECGEQGLSLALDIGDRLVAKNLYYLLAETAVRAGDRFRAKRYLAELAQYYPEIPESEEIVEILMGTDFTQVVNLRG
jgi:tetratricopeptide (TPR) repeat protein